MSKGYESPLAFEITPRITHAFRWCHSPPKTYFLPTIYLGGGFKYFLNCHPYLGEDEPILTHIFSDGLVQPPTSLCRENFMFLYMSPIKLTSQSIGIPLTEPKHCCWGDSRTPGHHILTKWGWHAYKNAFFTHHNSHSESYCWWFRNPANHLIGMFIPLFTKFYVCQVVQDFFH